ncbi:poly-gamma-glutamate system protein [bacterium]|nr:poly-gamma-glutamate system protein [bacterium]
MRSKRTLVILFVVSVIAYLWAENSRVFKRTSYYEEKLAAAEWMSSAMDTLRQIQYKRGVFPDEINDPNLTTLIGQQYTQITTDIGDLEEKWTALNPNMAAVMVQYLKDAGLKRGDNVAAGLTGSLPGTNLAFYAACEVLQVKPIVITSVGASSWGANDPNFNWLDMEHTLMDNGMLRYRSVAASIGGGEDLGGRLSPEGREMIRVAASRNDVLLVEEESLEQSVARRMEIFTEYAAGKKYDLYINIGGGLASIGHSSNSDLIPTGISDPLPIVNYPRRGVVHSFDEAKVPVLNIQDINEIASIFDLPRTPSPLPEPGEGALFSEERYNLVVSSVALAIVLATLFIVLLFDRRTQRLDREGVDPDTLI